MSTAQSAPVLVVKDLKEQGISISRKGAPEPLVTHHAQPHERPYLHPLRAPRGPGILTENHPSHHKHQTGLYFGITGANGLSYFHRFEGPMFRRRTLRLHSSKEDQTAWELEYDLLDDETQPLLIESQNWRLTDCGDHYLLDVAWRLEAATPVHFEEKSYGGLFLRMPHKGEGRAVNSIGQTNGDAEGQRAQWVDVGMPIEGRLDWGHITLMDHPDNPGHPVPWRVDHNLGVGPSRSRLGAWDLAAGCSTLSRTRILVYTGQYNNDLIEKYWQEIGSGT